jgi:hypothetical protein
VLAGIMSDVNAASAARVAAAYAVLAFGDCMRAGDSAPKGKNGLEGGVVGVEWAGLPEGDE